MKKVNVLWVILDSIFVILFNTFFYVSGNVSEYNSAVWLSYSFIHIAYGMLLITPLITVKNKNLTVLGYPLYAISSVYFLVEFVVGLVFIFIAPESIKIPLLTQLTLLGIYAIILVSMLIANEQSEKNVEIKQKQIAFIKETTSLLKLILGKTNNKESYKIIERVYDLCNSSPVKSHQEITPIENEIMLLINKLDKFVSANENDDITTLTTSLIDLIEQRNIKLKSL